MSLLLVHGEERWLVDDEARRWCAPALEGQLAVEIFDAPSRLRELRGSLLEMPLFDPERFVLVRDPPQLHGNARKGADGAESLGRLLEECPPTTSVCLVAHAKVAAGNPVPATVIRLGGRVSYHPAPRGRDLQTWVRSAAAERGLRLPSRAIEHLIRVAGSDLGVIAGELDKLSAYGGGRQLTMADIEGLVAGDERVQMWSVVEGLLGPDPGRGAAALESLVGEGRPPQYLLATLAGQVREVLLAQSLLRRPGGSGGALAAALGIPGWRADRLARQARSAPAPLVRSWLRALQRLDARIKAGEVADADGLRSFAIGAAAGLVEARSSGEAGRRGR